MSVYAVAASSRARQPEVAVEKLEENEMTFEVRKTDTSTANALRRVIISEVVTLAIDLVTFEANTSSRGAGTKRLSFARRAERARA